MHQDILHAIQCFIQKFFGMTNWIKNDTKSTRKQFIYVSVVCSDDDVGCGWCDNEYSWPLVVESSLVVEEQFGCSLIKYSVDMEFVVGINWIFSLVLDSPWTTDEFLNK